MKKRYFSILAIVVVAVLLCTVFMACSQSEEDYYNDIAQRKQRQQRLGQL